MRHKTKDKGDLAVAKTLAHLLEHGIRCCLPLSEHLPFDLIAVMPDMRTRRRVQVKFRSAYSRGVIVLPFRANYYDSKRIYAKRVNLDEIDCYTLYCPDTEEIYYLRVDEIAPDAISVTFRIEPTKNYQKKGIWQAKDFTDPYRIAAFDEIKPVIRRETNEKSELAIAWVIANLTEHGIQPCIPQSQYVPFDLVAVMPDMKTMYRLRIGYGSVSGEAETDYYAIYDPDSKCVLYIKADSVPAGIVDITTQTPLKMLSQLNGAVVG